MAWLLFFRILVYWNSYAREQLTEFIATLPDICKRKRSNQLAKDQLRPKQQKILEKDQTNQKEKMVTFFTNIFLTHHHFDGEHEYDI